MIEMVSAQVTLTAHLRILQGRLEARSNESLEALLGDLVPDLARSLADLAGRPGVDLLGQATETDIGRPDFSVKSGRLLIGHVETKAPGDGADVTRFAKGHNREQWERFKKLPNLLYTDGISFALYRSGVREGQVLTVAFDERAPGQEADTDDAARLVALLTRFLSWRAVAPRTLLALAEQLAPLCAVLRDEARTQLHDPGSEVSKAAREFEAALFPGRTEDEIADAFAQVCTYSMLLARANGASGLDGHAIEAALGHGHPVLGRVVRVLLDEQTEAELGWALDTLRALIEVVDFDRLREAPQLSGMTHHDQTWLYFYEVFLARYDPRLRDQYGVYYTPQQVIGAQVRLLDEVLRTRLGMPLGFASPGVTVLDPAVGTGGYPIRVVEQAAQTAAAKLGTAAVPGLLRGLAGNLYAFEALVGPYAVAHLRLAEVLQSFDAEVPGEGVNVYLADTLDSPDAEPQPLSRLLEPLVAEQRNAVRVKRDTPVLVCLGNPPYERGRRGEHGGGWVVHGNRAAAGKVSAVDELSPPIFEAFLAPARDAGRGGHLKNLYNEYVYFWRWALWKVFERPGTTGAFSDRPGAVSFITAASFIAGPGFVGMRERLRRACDEIWVIHLGGEGRGARREDNVFAIQTPVAITIAVRGGAGDPKKPAQVRFARISGDREAKLAALDAISGLADLGWEDCPTGWGDPLAPHSEVAWTAMPAVAALFPWQSSGCQIKRTWPIAPVREVLKRRWAALLDSRDGPGAFRESRDRKITSTPAPLGGGARPSAIAELPRHAPAPEIVRYGYRPFDRQWLLADSRVGDYLRPELWRARSARQVYMVSFLTETLGVGPAAVAFAAVPDLHSFRGSFGGRHVIPLYRDAVGTPNVAAGLLDALGERLGRQVDAEELFAYAYAILSSPRYTARFFDELRQPGPRLPLTAEPELFARTAALGAELLWLHTYGERYTSSERAPGAVPAGRAQWRVAIDASPAAFPTEFHHDDRAHELRIGDGVVAPVAPAVWDYAVSGYPVISSWLRFRMRDGAGRAKRSTSPLDRIRPSIWPPEYSVELLELLWTVEQTIARQDDQAALVDTACDGELIPTPELPLAKNQSANADPDQLFGVHSAP